MQEINRFRGPHRFLSNFFPVEIEYEGQFFPSVEHAYQAAKTLDKQDRQRIADLDAGPAKRYGRTVKMRSNWNQIKLSIMLELLRIKFSHPVLARMLRATEDAVLIEGNTWHDQFWGSCQCEKHKNVPGQNHLGMFLMEIREEL